MVELNIKTWPCNVDEKEIVVYGELKGNPLSKARARLGKYGNFYTPKETVNYEKALWWIMKAQLKSVLPDGESYFGVRAIFYRSSKQRVDCDNLMKCIFDAGNKLVYNDDSQITEEFGKLFLAHNNPRVVFLIYKVKDTISNTKCPQCLKEFFRSPSLSKRIYCSKECFHRFTTSTSCVIKTCQVCFKKFSLAQCIARASKGLYCSHACSAIGNGRKKTEMRGSQHWKCHKCGGRVSRKEYTRCIQCFLESRSVIKGKYWSMRKAVV